MSRRPRVGKRRGEVFSAPSSSSFPPLPPAAALSKIRPGERGREGGLLGMWGLPAARPSSGREEPWALQIHFGEVGGGRGKGGGGEQSASQSIKFLLSPPKPGKKPYSSNEVQMENETSFRKRRRCEESFLQCKSLYSTQAAKKNLTHFARQRVSPTSFFEKAAREEVFQSFSSAWYNFNLEAESAKKSPKCIWILPQHLTARWRKERSKQENHAVKKVRKKLFGGWRCRLINKLFCVPVPPPISPRLKVANILGRPEKKPTREYITVFLRCHLARYNCFVSSLQVTPATSEGNTAGVTG